MARLARNKLLYDGCYSHVFSRAVDKKRIFESEADFSFFKNLLNKQKKQCLFKIYHYCLMNTHFHLVVSIPNVALFSKALQQTKWAYTKWFNGKNERSGPLWTDRFNSMLIEDERYLLACGLYVEQNPVKAGMVKRCERWPHSSSPHWFLGKRDDLVDFYHQPTKLPKGTSVTDDSFYTKGPAIGSLGYRMRFEPPKGRKSKKGAGVVIG